MTTTGGDEPSSCPPHLSTSTLPGATGGGDLQPVTTFGDNPGALAMYVHAPASGKASAVVVALHGCTQSASAYVGAGWNELADKAGFVVVYAEQSSANNLNRCFNWYEAGDTARGQGEARSIAAMTEYAKKTYGATKAYVTGLSAGAAMTAVMLATYPDLFEAGAIMAGLPYDCATSMTDAFSCMNPGKTKTPEQWAALLPKVSGANPPRVSIWQGDADWTVRPANMDALVAQFTAANSVADKASSTETEGPATHEEYKDSSGVVRVESWLIKGMSHGVAISAKEGCGTAGAYILDVGLCSTTKAAAFFGLVTESGAPSNPSASTPGTSTGSSGSSSGDCD